MVRTEYEQLGGWSRGLARPGWGLMGAFLAVGHALRGLGDGLGGCGAVCGGCVQGVCMCVCVRALGKTGCLAVWLKGRLCILTWFSGSRALAASEAAAAPFARPQMWSAPFPPAGLVLGCCLRQGLPSGEPAGLGFTPPPPGSLWGGASCLGGEGLLQGSAW